MRERFDDEELRAAYHAAHAAGGPATERPGRAACPEPDALLAAVRGEGDRAERARVLDHALQCAACRRELALLHAISPPPPRGAIVGRLAAGRSWRRVGPLAAAASIVLAAGLIGVGRWRERERGGDVVREGGEELGLVAPAAGASVARGPVAFVWRAVPGAFVYTLEVDATDGTVLATATTADTQLVAPLGAVAGGEHRWSVRARLGDGSERRSAIRRLRLR